MKYCTKCGNEIEDSVNVCPHCGVPTDGYNTNVSSAAKSKPLKGKAVGVVLGLFLGLIGLILGICLGDEQAKKGSILGFVIGIIFNVIYFVFLVLLELQTM